MSTLTVKAFIRRSLLVATLSVAIFPLTVYAACNSVNAEHPCGSSQSIGKASKSSGGSYSSSDTSSGGHSNSNGAVAAAGAGAIIGIIRAMSSSSSSSSQRDSERRAYESKQRAEEQQRIEIGQTASSEINKFDSEYNQLFNDAKPSGGSVLTASKTATGSDAANFDFSGDCETVQRKGVQYVENIKRIAESRGPAICASAKDAKLLGEIAVKVAESCQIIPTWESLRDVGRKQIQEANRVIAGSCAN